MLSMLPLIQTVLPYLRAFLREEEGQDFAEYSLILVIVVIVAAAGFAGMGQAISNVAVFVTNWLAPYGS